MSPIAQRSAEGPTFDAWPRACSGDMYQGVPKMVPSCVSSADTPSVSFAMPKSRILISGDAVVPHGQVQVRGLEVAVDDAELVRLVERPRDLAEVEHDLARRERAAPLELRPEVVPVELLHDQEGHVAELGADVGVEDAHDVVGADPHRRPRLRAEALDRLRVAGERGVEDLEREHLARVHVLDPVHRAHPAAAEEALDLVAARDDAARGRSCPWARRGAAPAAGRARARPPPDAAGGRRGGDAASRWGSGAEPPSTGRGTSARWDAAGVPRA